MFPKSITGEFTLNAPTFEFVDGVLRQIEHSLEEARATSIVRTGNKITFRGTVSRLTTGLGVLAPVGDGEIEVVPGNPGSLKYNFSCTEMLSISIIGSIFLGLVVLAASNTPTYWFLTPLGAWVFLFGLNYLMALLRLQAFVKRIAGF